MYWQKRLSRSSGDIEMEAKIKEIRKENENFDYRRIWGKLREAGIKANRKRVQRIVQKWGRR